MIRTSVLALACAMSFAVALAAQPAQAQQGVGAPQPQGFGAQWGRSYNTQDWNRFYHYPYVYYPQNFWSSQYYKSSDDMYFRYPPEMRTPVYNKAWHNMLPEGQLYHFGHHFILDQF